ncbi:MAG: hypothetical protein JOZ13_08430 [Alphaproteobacteria bacterium]|nr:hypothetical protein [Alphaproteobacteria bacterium]
MIVAAPPSVSDLREWLTLSIALAAVIFGPLIQAGASKKDREAHARALKDELAAQRETTERQIFASVRSTNRQAWINALREDVASYLNASQRMAWLRAHGIAPQDGNELDKLMFEAGRTFTAIELRLNPNEDSHIELMAHLQALSSGIQGAPESYNSLRDEVVRQAQSIFKFEWNRVKIGE